ncbi:MAG TPA: hypothetical protein DDY16_05560 [Tenacibaculum sp.]|nr:hypothetical protein [Tenacibaculum sp.]
MILCFSDGVATLSSLAVTKNTPVFIVNTKTEAAHDKWNTIAEQTKGSCLNLNRMSLQQSLHSLRNLNLSYLGYRSASANMEVYRAQSSQGPSNFSVTGKGFLQGEKITLLFGFGEQVVKEVSLTLQKNTEEELPIQRIWTKNKVQTLLKEEKRNQKEILHTAIQYGLVTD